MTLLTSRHALLRIAVAAGLVATAASAEAKVDPSRCTAPACVLSCPDGDFGYRVVARNALNQPEAGREVVLDLSRCAEWTHCLPASSPAYPEIYDEANRFVRSITGQDGAVTFHLVLGDGCEDDTVWVFVDGVFIGSPTLTSADQTGDLSVTSADVDLATAKLGTGDRTADFDGDGTVTRADIAILESHRAHVCQVAVPTRPSTWGRLKLLYR